MKRFTALLHKERQPSPFELELYEFLGRNQGRPKFGFRASCLEHWSWQFLDDDVALNDPAYPSQIRRAQILESYGYTSKIIYIKSDKESARVFCRGDDFTSDDLVVFIQGAWLSEAAAKEKNLSWGFLMTRREAANDYAKKQIQDRKKAKIVQARAREEKERETYVNLEIDARDAIREALLLLPKGSQEVGPDSVKLDKRQKEKMARAEARWRRHYKRTGESLSGREAILPKLQERKPRSAPERLKTIVAPPIYQFEQTPHPAPAMRDPDPYEAPSVLYQAPSVLSYGDEDDAPSYQAPSVLYQAPEDEQPAAPSNDARIEAAQRVLRDPKASYSERVKASAEFERALFAYDGRESPHNMSRHFWDARALRAADRREGERMLGTRPVERASVAVWHNKLSDWLGRAETELAETQPLTVDGFRSSAPPIFCIPVSSLRLAVNTWFGEKTVSPKKLSSFMREHGFEAGNKMWRGNKAMRVYYKNCKSAAIPERVLVCNLNDNESGVTWGMERGAVLREQF